MKNVSRYLFLLIICGITANAMQFRKYYSGNKPVSLGNGTPPMSIPTSRKSSHKHKKRASESSPDDIVMMQIGTPQKDYFAGRQLSKRTVEIGSIHRYAMYPTAVKNLFNHYTGMLKAYGISSFDNETFLFGKVVDCLNRSEIWDTMQPCCMQLLQAGDCAHIETQRTFMPILIDIVFSFMQFTRACERWKFTEQSSDVLDALFEGTVKMTSHKTFTFSNESFEKVMSLAQIKNLTVDNVKKLLSRGKK